MVSISLNNCGVKCDLPKVEHGELVNSSKPSYAYNVGITFECNSGYSAVGSLHIKCGENSSWVPGIPKCVKDVKCDLPKVENGKLVNSSKPSYAYNDAISFECNSGYFAVGSLHIKCGANSLWVPDVPKCVKDVKCDLPKVENGKLVNSSKPSYTYNDVISFECNPGYSAVGSLHIKCGENSLWVPDIPKCVKGNVGNTNSTTDKPNTTTKDYAEYHKTTALGKLIILLAVLYNCW
ncbi:membrane cofactor protein-like [Thamnophis elegans]|uniref:membrane cofactor protein-like n=1 Tax=Thamnophis elegans TaxID=35005 RepID=UPI0013765982|nr:membrane cofactor protein-like [Thamnophis elegans]